MATLSPFLSENSRFFFSDNICKISLAKELEILLVLSSAISSSNWFSFRTCYINILFPVLVPPKIPVEFTSHFCSLFLAMLDSPNQKNSLILTCFTTSNFWQSPVPEYGIAVFVGLDQIFITTFLITLHLCSSLHSC